MMMTRNLGLPGLGADMQKMSREKQLEHWLKERGLPHIETFGFQGRRKDG